MTPTGKASFFVHWPFIQWFGTSQVQKKKKKKEVYLITTAPNCSKCKKKKQNPHICATNELHVSIIYNRKCYRQYYYVEREDDNFGIRIQEFLFSYFKLLNIYLKNSDIHIFIIQAPYNLP